MAIKGTLSRIATIGGRVAGATNVRAKQVAIGTGVVQTYLQNQSTNFQM